MDRYVVGQADCRFRSRAWIDGDGYWSSLSEKMDGRQMDGLIDGLMDGWMQGWTDALDEFID